MIGQVLRIHSVNARISITTTQPTVSIKTQKPELTISRQRGDGLEINTKPIRMQVDSSECRAQLDIKSAFRVISESAQTGMQAAQDAAGSAAEAGDIMLDSGGGTDALIQVAQMKFDNTPIEEGFTLPAQPEISWEPNSIRMSYTPDTLKFNAAGGSVRYEPVRGAVRIEVSREPSVTYAFTGEPNLFPGSRKFDIKA